MSTEQVNGIEQKSPMVVIVSDLHRYPDVQAYYFPDSLDKMLGDIRDSINKPSTARIEIIMMPVGAEMPEPK